MNGERRGLVAGADWLVLATLAGCAAPVHAAIHAGESRFVHAPSAGGTVRLNEIRERDWKPRLLDDRRA
jgi:cell wall-associated NlpC family hydrolase